MNRRIHAVTLIVLLVGGTTARSAFRPAALRAQVAIRSEEPEKLHALCASMRNDGLRVRVVQMGRSAWVEIAATSPTDLSAALRALRRAAEAQGMDFRLRTAAEEAPQAISARPAGAKQPPTAPGHVAPAAVVMAERPQAAASTVSPPVLLPKLARGARLCSRGLRGPPA